MTFTFYADTGLNQIEKVKREAKLPRFELNEFLDELYQIKDDNEYKLAFLVLQLAVSKIKYTGEEAGFKSNTQKQILDSLHYEIDEIKRDHENFYNIDFEMGNEPEENFSIGSDAKGIINIEKLPLFNAIESRLISENCFRSDGTWCKSNEDLGYIINLMYWSGFFKSRTSKGRWNDMEDIFFFFGMRYNVTFEKINLYTDTKCLEPNGDFSWLKEYFSPNY